MEKIQKDPVSLQTLLSTLTAFNQRYHNPNKLWKITNEESSFKSPDGKPIVTKDRLTNLSNILYGWYLIEVKERNMKIQPFNSHVFNACVRFLSDRSTRSSLMLYGNPGTGKTTFMLAMRDTIRFLYKEELDRYQLTMEYIKASSLGEIMKKDKEGFKKIKTSTCLFIDDLGFNGESEVVNDYGVKARPIEDIIEHRYDNQLMTVCTTNLTDGEIRSKYGERIYSRIRETFAMVAVTGADYRIST